MLPRRSGFGFRDNRRWFDTLGHMYWEGHHLMRARERSTSSDELSGGKGNSDGYCQGQGARQLQL